MKHPKLEVYKAADGWRWRLKSKNGKIICESGEAYAKKLEVGVLYRRLEQTFYEADLVELP